MLEPIPWTYIGVTQSAGVELEGTCYSAMGNILQGKQTRRAQRVALRVRPLGNQSQVKVVVRNNPNETQPGCQIYQKDLLTDDLTFVGHTDWRGMITIERTEELGLLLPERVKIERQAARQAAQAAADKAAMESEAAKRAAVQAATTKGDAAKEATPKEDKKPAEEEDSRGPGMLLAMKSRTARLPLRRRWLRLVKRQRRTAGTDGSETGRSTDAAFGAVVRQEWRYSLGAVAAGSRLE